MRYHVTGHITAHLDLHIEVEEDAGPSEYVVNGTFTSDSAWTKGSGWTIGSGAGLHDGSAPGNLVGTLVEPLVPGNNYVYSIDVVNPGSIEINLQIRTDGGSVQALALIADASGTFSNTFQAANASNQVYVAIGEAGSALQVDNISITPA
jgi:hypothetical protein